MPAAAQSKRKTTRFEKVALVPGTYAAVKNGRRVVDSYPVDRLQRIAESGNQMIANGLKIPLPFLHYDSKGKAPLPVLESNGGLVDPTTGKEISWDASINGGFVEEWKVNEKGALVAIIEAPGDVEDLNTPSGKLGTTVQQVSLAVANDFTDGLGRVYKDAPVHLAACVHAVQPDQENFSPINGIETLSITDALLMGDAEALKTQITVLSAGVPRDNSGGNLVDSEGDQDAEISGENTSIGLPQVLALLRQMKSPIDLPADTSDDTFIERLGIALLQKKADQNSEENDDTSVPKPPKGATEKPGYTTMSQVPNATQTTPPVEPPKVEKPTDGQLTLMNMLAASTKDALNSRISKLIERGVPQKWVDDNLKPKVDVTVLSFGDVDQATGKIKTHAEAESLLKCVESLFDAMNITTMSSLGSRTDYFPGMPDGSYEMSPPELAQSKADQAAADAFIQDIKGYESIADAIGAE